MTQSRHSASSCFGSEQPYLSIRSWFRYRPKADIGASAGNAIYRRDQGSCLPDIFCGIRDIASGAVNRRDSDDQGWALTVDEDALYPTMGML